MSRGRWATRQPLSSSRPLLQRCSQTPAQPCRAPLSPPQPCGSPPWPSRTFSGGCSRWLRSYPHFSEHPVVVAALRGARTSPRSKPSVSSRSSTLPHPRAMPRSPSHSQVSTRVRPCARPQSTRSCGGLGTRRRGGHALLSLTSCGRSLLPRDARSTPCVSTWVLAKSKGEAGARSSCFQWSHCLRSIRALRMEGARRWGQGLSCRALLLLSPHRRRHRQRYLHPPRLSRLPRWHPLLHPHHCPHQ